MKMAKAAYITLLLNVGHVEGRGLKYHGRGETGSAITWKYPSCLLQGEGSVGEFYSVAVTNNAQQADTGTKMIHIGANTKSTIISKGISAGRSNNTYRGLVRMMPGAENARNFTQCDSLLVGDQCGAHTVPYITSRNPSTRLNMKQQHRAYPKISCFTVYNGE